MSDEAFLGTLNISLNRSNVRYKVIQFDGHEGIVRVNGADRDSALKALTDVGGDALITLRTSGTLKTLRQEVLSEKKPDARA